MGKSCLMTAVVLGLTALILVLAVAVGGQLALNAKAEREIMAVFADHYRGHSLSVEGRSDFLRRWDYQFHYQACFDLVLDGRERRIAMVQGDDDGGSFSFGREYASVRDCEAHFSRG